MIGVEVSKATLLEYGFKEGRDAMYLDTDSCFIVYRDDFDVYVFHEVHISPTTEYRAELLKRNKM